MKRKIRNVSLAQQLSLMTCLCLLIPMVLLSVSMIRSVRTTTLTTRQQEAAAASVEPTYVYKEGISAEVMQNLPPASAAGTGRGKDAS